MTAEQVAKAVEEAVLDYQADRDVAYLLRTLEAIVKGARR